MSTGLALRDPAVTVIGVVVKALQDAYRADSSFPPVTATETVHFFAGQAAATAVWNPAAGALTDWSETGCEEPFLWVRLDARYHAGVLPNHVVDTNCDAPRAIALEVGVARCAVLDMQPSWDDYETEAALSLEDSYRLETAKRCAAGRLRDQGYLVALEDVVPFGPQGGIIGWSGMIHIQLS